MVMKVAQLLTAENGHCLDDKLNRILHQNRVLSDFRSSVSKTIEATQLYLQFEVDRVDI